MAYSAVSPAWYYGAFIAMILMLSCQIKRPWIAFFLFVVITIYVAMQPPFMGTGLMVLHLATFILAIINSVIIVLQDDLIDKLFNKKPIVFNYTVDEISKYDTKRNFRQGIKTGIKFAMTAIPIFFYILSILHIFPLVIVNQNYACISKLKTIGSALEYYSTYHKGKYPEKLNELVPNYLEKIPRCLEICKEDSWGAKHYTKAYGFSFENYIYTISPDRKAYTMYCKGKNHLQTYLPENFPQYSSSTGVIEREYK